MATDPSGAFTADLLLTEAAIVDVLGGTVPVGPVNKADDLFGDPHTAALTLAYHAAAQGATIRFAGERKQNNLVAELLEVASISKSGSSFAFTRQLYNMLQLARVITQGAMMRDESRGSHYKPDFPERDDANWLKTTKAYFAPDADEPRFEWEPVDTSLIKPRPRRYDVAK